MNYSLNDDDHVADDDDDDDCVEYSECIGLNWVALPHQPPLEYHYHRHHHDHQHFHRHSHHDHHHFHGHQFDGNEMILCLIFIPLQYVCSCESQKG